MHASRQAFIAAYESEVDGELERRVSEAVKRNSLAEKRAAALVFPILRTYKRTAGLMNALKRAMVAQPGGNLQSNPKLRQAVAAWVRSGKPHTDLVKALFGSPSEIARVVAQETVSKTGKRSNAEVRRVLAGWRRAVDPLDVAAAGATACASEDTSPGSGSDSEDDDSNASASEFGSVISEAAATCTTAAAANVERTATPLTDAGPSAAEGRPDAKGAAGKSRAKEWPATAKPRAGTGPGAARPRARTADAAVGLGPAEPSACDAALVDCLSAGVGDACWELLPETGEVLLATRSIRSAGDKLRIKLSVAAAALDALTEAASWPEAGEPERLALVFLASVMAGLRLNDSESDVLEVCSAPGRRQVLARVSDVVLNALRAARAWCGLSIVNGSVRSGAPVPPAGMVWKAKGKPCAIRSQLALTNCRPSECHAHASGPSFAAGLKAARALLLEDARKAKNSSCPSSIRKLVTAASKCRKVPLPAARRGGQAGTKATGNWFEDRVLSVILANCPGLRREDIISEDEHREACAASGMAPQSTPDMLFRGTLTVLGRPVNWIECKHGWVVPGVTASGLERQLAGQLSRYTSAFGPGLVVWGKGVTAEVLAMSEDVLHVCAEHRPEPRGAKGGKAKGGKAKDGKAKGGKAKGGKAKGDKARGGKAGKAKTGETESEESGHGEARDAGPECTAPASSA
ncbi:hypothetical protein FNF27_07795 [Cafeteria roenbergensis]|uniref:Uncharacterized protein n=1 Tax=Cafeteria roenbergensis TaxID=33653 RepID=A0A5A8DH35_CAFRO|nr:hypothetical protein FNF27_07795 [Cafeteria roenbergensis]